MRRFRWEDHEVAPAQHADGQRRPFWMRWFWFPGVAWLGFNFWVVLTHHRIEHPDDYVLNAAALAAIGIVIWIVLSLTHLHEHRPASLARVRTAVNAFVIIYWADQALHAVIRHYDDHDG